MCWANGRGSAPRDLRDSDANGFVQKAISAANVYNNIVKYVDDANITSLTTLNLSKSSEEVRGFPNETPKALSWSSSSQSVAPPPPLLQTVAQINVHLDQLVKQSDSVFKESVSLHSEQIGTTSPVCVRARACACV